MKRTCPVCGARVEVVSTYACGHEFHVSRAGRQSRSMEDARAAWWDALQAKTADLAARGVNIGLDELTSHRKRRPLTRLRDLYNLERAKNKLPPLNFLDFDPWGAHKEAQKHVIEAFELTSEPDTPHLELAWQAERLFGVKIEMADAAVEAEIEKWLADQRAKEEATV